MAAASAVKEALWLRNLLSDLGLSYPTIHIKADSQSAIKLLKNPIFSMRSKHIDVIYHFARERVARKDVAFQYIKTVGRHGRPGQPAQQRRLRSPAGAPPAGRHGWTRPNASCHAAQRQLDAAPARWHTRPARWRRAPKCINDTCMPHSPLHSHPRAPCKRPYYPAITTGYGPRPSLLVAPLLSPHTGTCGR